MSSFLNILWLGIKELRSLLSDVVMVAFVVYAVDKAAARADRRAA